MDDEVELFGEASLFSRYDDFWKLRRRIFSRIQFPAAIFTRLFAENLIPTFSCAVCRAEVIKKCSFDYFYAPHLDRSLWLQICKNHKFHHIGEPLSCWRIHGSSYISSEQKAYRKDFLKKVCHLLAPCYKCHRINPAFYLAILCCTPLLVQV